MTIKWGLPATDRPLMTKVIDRAEAAGLVRTKNRVNLTMDITACHLNGELLDLDRLLHFPDFDFAHDIAGISAHIDRETGRLLNCFVPRCARRYREQKGARDYAEELIARAESVD